MVTGGSDQGPSRVKTISHAFNTIRLRLTTQVKLYLGFQILYGINVFKCYPLVGDAADYASLVSHGVVTVRTTHIGFYILYYPFYRLPRLAGLDCDWVANGFTSLLAALAVAVLYLFLREIISGDHGRREMVAVLGACFYGLAGLIWYHAEFAEVQSAMLLVTFLALVAFVRKSYMLSGAILGFAALISQACAPAGLWFVALAFTRRVGLRKFLVFALSFAVVLAAGVLPVFNDFIHGPRGLLPSTEYYHPAPITKTVLTFGYSALESFWLLVPLLILSARPLLREKELFWMALASVPGFLCLGCRLCHVEYGFVWMPLYALITAVLAIGWESVQRRLPSPGDTWVTAGLVFIFAATTYFTYLKPKYDQTREANECLVRIAREVEDGLLVAAPHVGFVYAHRIWPETADVTQAGWSMDARSALEWSLLPESSPCVYVLDYTPPSHFLRRLILDNSLARAHLPEEKRLQFLSEFDAMSDEVRALDPTLSPEAVISCGSTRLWSLNCEESDQPRL